MWRSRAAPRSGWLKPRQSEVMWPKAGWREISADPDQSREGQQEQATQGRARSTGLKITLTVTGVIICKRFLRPPRDLCATPVPPIFPRHRKSPSGTNSERPTQNNCPPPTLIPPTVSPSISHDLSIRGRPGALLRLDYPYSAAMPLR